MRTLSTNQHPCFVCYITVFLLLFGLGETHAQQQSWEIDRIQERRQLQQLQIDSTINHLATRWEIRLSWGKWHPSANTQSELSNGSMNTWQLGTSWHMKERLVLDLDLGVQIRKDIPATPDIGSIINGETIQVEGSGIVFLPLEFGLRYYLSAQKFRPIVGIKTGVVSANAKYILAEGSLITGFLRTEEEFKGRTGFIRLISGFDYRLGGRMNFLFHLSYTQSGEFTESIGGYSRYSGIGGQLGLSFLL